MNKKVIDISKHNGKIDMKKVKNDGVYGIIQRIGYGSNHLDETAYTNIDNALKENLKVGIYWFMYAINREQAIKEGINCVKYIKKYDGKLELPIFCDFEYDTERYANQLGVTFNKRSRTDIVKAFCDYIEKEGYFVGVYSNIDYLENKFYQEELKQYSLWLAHWNVDKPKYKCDMWQYTNKGRIPGINGNVDVNILYKDYPLIIKENNLNGFKQVNQNNIELNKAINIIAQHTIKGVFGNGDARKENIYKAIQKEVNNILKDGMI